MQSSLNLVAAVDFTTLPQQLVNGLLLGAIYALIALGYTMVYGVLRLINFAHGEVYMLGAYISLFISYWLGFVPGSGGNSSVFNLLLMLLGSMIICALVGVIIERFAYRPMRGHSRIASLITAIGVSLLLQYGGALFLPNSPPPSINEKVNPFRDQAYTIWLKKPPQALLAGAVEAKPAYDQAKKAFDEWYTEAKKKDPKLTEFEIKDPVGVQLKDASKAAEKKFKDLDREANNSGVNIKIQYGQAIMLLSTLGLMAILTYLVMFTKSGRAMRAVSHDFDSAALMGVNVNNTITFTFILGSSLAGAAAMMTATFLGTPLTTFYGLAPGVKAFVAAVLGGIGNIPGAVLGGLLMGMAENMVVWSGHSEYRDAIAFIILIVVLLFRPGGLLGSSKVEKV